MRIAVGCDHGGYVLKDVVSEHLAQAGHEVVDVGIHTPESVDYPDIAHELSGLVARGEVQRGVLVCGTGQGMAMVVNKRSGVRAAVVSDVFSARMAMEHNDARVLCLGERILGVSLATVLVDAWLGSEFGGGRHARRVAKIEGVQE